MYICRTSQSASQTAPLSGEPLADRETFHRIDKARCEISHSGLCFTEDSNYFFFAEAFVFTGTGRAVFFFTETLLFSVARE